MIDQKEDGARRDSPAEREKPKVKPLHLILGIITGIWLLIILDCFCQIHSNYTVSLGSVRVMTRPEEDIGYHTYENWGGTGQTRTLYFRHLALVIEP